MKIRRAKGFTLLELLITISIAGILLAIGIPSFSSMMADSKINAQYGSLEGALFRARSESIKGATDVTVCPKNAEDSLQCGNDSNWRNGWIVFRDAVNVPTESIAVVENPTDIISVFPAIKGLNTVRSIGSATNSVANLNQNIGYVRYLQNGSSTLTTGSIIICDANRGAVASRSINIVQTGDIRSGTGTATVATPRDVFNRAISPYCPDPT